MKEKLTKLYNTLAQVETKGENTKLMAACLNFTQQLICEVAAEQGTNETVKGE
jgi:hypothetical protein